MRRVLRIIAACTVLSAPFLFGRMVLDLLLTSQAGAGSTQNVAKLLSYGADPNASHYKAGAAMVQAIYQNHPDIVKQLLKAGANPDLPLNDNGDTAMMMAAGNDGQVAVQELVDAKANVWITDKACKTALDFAVANDDPTAQEEIMAGQDLSPHHTPSPACPNQSKTP